MAKVERYKIRAVRLEDDVWAKVKAMDCSLNQYLKEALLGYSPANKEAPEPDKPVRDFSPDPEPIDNRPKNCFCKHCGGRFAGLRYASICPTCKASGHTLTPNECPRCGEGTGI
jgi:hypothetical protein